MSSNNVLSLKKEEDNHFCNNNFWGPIAPNTRRTNKPAVLKKEMRQVYKYKTANIGMVPLHGTDRLHIASEVLP